MGPITNVPRRALPCVHVPRWGGLVVEGRGARVDAPGNPTQRRQRSAKLSAPPN